MIVYRLQAGEVMAAHADRISCLALHGSTLYSTSFDGSIKAWNVNTLEAVAAVPAAHEGEKIHAIVLGSDGLLYTGGDDKVNMGWKARVAFPGEYAGLTFTVEVATNVCRCYLRATPVAN